MDAELQRIIFVAEKGLEEKPQQYHNTATICRHKTALANVLSMLRSYVPPRTEVVVKEADGCDFYDSANHKTVAWQCPNCGQNTAFIIERRFNYCPSCGKYIVWQLSKDRE